MTQSITNNAVTTLVGDITSTQTTLTVLSDAKFPQGGSAPYTILIDSEYMLVTGGFGTVNWTVTRGTEGSTPAGHNGTTNPATVQLELTAGVLAALADGGPNNAWTFLRPSGVTGATNTSRYVGGVSGGPPTTGTFNTGDWVNDSLYGVFWTCTAGGSPGTWKPSGSVPIFDSTLGSAAGSISITVPTAFVGSALEIDLFLRSASAVLDSVNAQFNGNTTGTAYSAVGVQGSGSVASSGNNIGTSFASLGDIPGANSAANYFGGARLVIPNYGVTGPLSWTATWGALGPTNALGMNAGSWTNNGPLTTVLLTTNSGSNFAAGSRVSARVMP